MRKSQAAQEALLSYAQPVAAHKPALSCQRTGHSMPHALSWKPAQIMATPQTISQQPGNAGSQVSSIPSVFQLQEHTQSLAKLSFHEVTNHFLENGLSDCKCRAHDASLYVLRSLQACQVCILLSQIVKDSHCQRDSW